MTARVAKSLSSWMRSNCIWFNVSIIKPRIWTNAKPISKMKIVRPAKLRGESDRLNDVCRKRTAFLVNSGRIGNVAIGDILRSYPDDRPEAPGGTSFYEQMKR